MPQYPHAPKGLNMPRIVTVDEFDSFVCQYTNEAGKLVRYVVSSEDIALKDKEYHEASDCKDFTYHVEHKVIKGEIPW
jgi:hypothetical protein